MRNGQTQGGLVIAGGDPAFRRRLLQSFGRDDHSRTVSDVATRPDLEARVAALVPSVIVFDLGSRADAKAIEIVSALSGVAKTIVLADVDDEALALRALEAGASGFCSRATPTALLRKAVHLVEAGEIWVGRRVLLRLIDELARLRPGTDQALSGCERLTRREREIANRVARGASNKDIAQGLSISIKTVKTHLTNTFKKLGLSTRLQLALALGRGPGPQTKVR